MPEYKVLVRLCPEPISFAESCLGLNLLCHAGGQMQFRRAMLRAEPFTCHAEDRTVYVSCSGQMGEREEGMVVAGRRGELGWDVM